MPDYNFYIFSAFTTTLVILAPLLIFNLLSLLKAEKDLAD